MKRFITVLVIWRMRSSRKTKCCSVNFDLNEHGEKVYRREGHRYVVEPVALVFHEDNYYIVVYSAKHDSTANYRIDRMDSVEIIDESVSQRALALRNEVAGYTERVFKMYGGQPVDIVIEFDDKLIGVVYDKFGESTKMIRTHEHMCVATVKVQISPTFWGGCSNLVSRCGYYPQQVWSMNRKR